MTVLPFPTQSRGAAVPALGPDHWEERAECTRTDPEAFYADDAQSKKYAKRVCEKCPVRALCLAKALKLVADGETDWGVWGGLDEKERRKLTPAQRQAAMAAARTILREAA